MIKMKQNLIRLLNLYNSRPGNLPEHSLQDILTQSSLLKDMTQKATKLVKLNQAVLKKLDPKLAPHCRVTNLQRRHPDPCNPFSRLWPYAAL